MPSPLPDNRPNDSADIPARPDLATEAIDASPETLDQAGLKALEQRGEKLGLLSNLGGTVDKLNIPFLPKEITQGLQDSPIETAFTGNVESVSLPPAIANTPAGQITTQIVQFLSPQVETMLPKGGPLSQIAGMLWRTMGPMFIYKQVTGWIGQPDDLALAKADTTPTKQKPPAKEEKKPQSKDEEGKEPDTEKDDDIEEESESSNTSTT